MEQLEAISKVSETTPWCAGMVVVPKSSGKIRICMDLKPLNECVVRELHSLKGVDYILAQLSGAKIFSKLDMNSGFRQVYHFQLNLDFLQRSSFQKVEQATFRHQQCTQIF